MHFKKPYSSVKQLSKSKVRGAVLRLEVLGLYYRCRIGNRYEGLVTIYIGKPGSSDHLVGQKGVLDTEEIEITKGRYQI